MKEQLLSHAIELHGSACLSCNENENNNDNNNTVIDQSRQSGLPLGRLCMDENRSCVEDEKHSASKRSSRRHQYTQYFSSTTANMNNDAVDDTIENNLSVNTASSKEKPSKPFSNRLIDQMNQQNEMNKDVIKFIHNHYNLQHVILGQGLFNPIVLFDPVILKDQQHSLPNNHLITQGVATTLQYEQTLATISMEMPLIQPSEEGEERNNSSIPLCLACCTGMMTYPYITNRSFLQNN